LFPTPRTVDIIAENEVVSLSSTIVDFRIRTFEKRDAYSVI